MQENVWIPLAAARLIPKYNRMAIEFASSFLKYGEQHSVLKGLGSQRH